MGLRRRSRVSPALPVALAGLGLVVFAACQDPTQLTLAISTNAKCHDELKATAIYVGGSLGGVNEKVQTSSPVAQTDTCASGSIGTLVVTPGSSEGAVVVIGGFYGKPPTDCVEGHYENCIIARRSFTFIKHASLVIPIPLERSCLNVPCNATTTCHNGACYDAAVECSSNGTCPVPGTAPGADSVDAGPMAVVEGGGPNDTDGSTESDSGLPTDSGSTPDADQDGGGTVDSGTDSGLVSRPYDAGGITCSGMPLLVTSCDTPGIQCAAGEGCCAPAGARECGSPAKCAGIKPVSCCAMVDCPSDLPCCVGGLPPPPNMSPVIFGPGTCQATMFFPGFAAGHCEAAP